jgi:glycosyltransferase involved in cell wall biosynthesis
MIKNRVFFISFRDFSGFVGGSAGVNYRLYHFEKEFKTFQNNVESFYYIFKNKTIKKEDIYKNLTPKHTQVRDRPIKIKVKEVLKNISKLTDVTYSMYLHYFFKRNVLRAKEFFRNLDQKFTFTDADIFVLQDMESAYALKDLVSSKQLVVYHGQGSLVNEIESLQGCILTSNFKNYLNKLQKDVCEYYNYVSFPSVGASKILLSEIKNINLKNSNIIPLYNTFNEAKFSEVDIKNFLNYFEFTKELQSNKLKFVSIGSLSHLKGFDLTIEILSKLKKKNIDFIWFMIGNGSEESITFLNNKLIEENIANNTIQIRNLPNIHVNILLSMTDFYIMMQRFSIFDIATLEAMNNGNIPVLSNVGGNLEYNLKNNAFLVEDNIEKLASFIKNSDLNYLKELNKKIAIEDFGPKSFLKRYLAYIEKIASSK